ncbi:MAG: hypothetical protein ABIQ11_04120 [Saprospiraceae bacterium]
MSANKSDNLDKFFQSKLKHDDMGEQWNVPPRSVLDRTFNQLSIEKDKRRKSLLFFSGSGLVVLLVVFVLFLTNRKLDNIDQKIDRLMPQSEVIPLLNPSDIKEDAAFGPSEDIRQKDHDKKTQADNNASYPLRAVDNLLLQEPLTLVENQPNLAPGNHLNPKELNDQSGNNGNNKVNFSDQIKSFRSPYNIPGQNQNPLTNDTEFSARADQSRIASEITMDRLNSPMVMLNKIDIQLLKSIDRMSGPIMFTKANLNENENDRLSSYLIIGYSLSSFKMSGTGNLDYSLTGYDRHYSGFHAGLGLNYGLTRSLSLELNTTVNFLKNQSVYEETMSYDKGNETMDITGQVHYRSRITMESPIGEFFNDALFSLGGNQINQDDDIDNVTAIDQRLQIINLSTGSNYMLMKKRRFSLFIGGGLGVSYLFGLDQNMNTKLFFHDVKMMDDSYQLPRQLNSNVVFMTAFGKIGIQYALNEKFYFHLNGGIENSLNSIRSSLSSFNVKTYLRSYKANMLIGYKF